MPVPLPREMLLFCAAAAALQLLFALFFLLRSRAGRRGRKGFSPGVSVIVPCKGAPAGLREGIGSILDQDYRGETEYVFVVPSASDPAFAGLQSLLAGEARARVAVSDAQPERCSEKALNLLHGVRLASPSASVLVFADADLVFRRDWLSALIAPLADPAVAVSTAHALPAAGGIADGLMRLWTEYGMVYLDSLGVVSGASAAVSKEDFVALGAEDAWRRTVSEDIELGRLARRAGRKVRFAAEAVPLQRERRSLPEVLAVTGKWTLYFKYYCPLIWVAGAVLTAFKLYAAAWAFITGHFLPLLLLLAGDATALNLVSSVFAGRSPAPSPDPAAAAFRRFSLILALPLLHAANFIYSALRREVFWGGRLYRLVSSSEVRVLPPGTSPLSAWAAPGPVLVLAGMLTGAAFFPEGNGWLFWFSMAPLFWAAMGTGLRGAFLAGWLFGTAAWVTGMHWMAGPIGAYLRVPPAAGLGAFLLLCAYQGLMFAVIAWASRAGSIFFSRRFGWSEGTALLVTAMPAAAAAENLFPLLFPVYFANTQLFSLPLVQILELTGPPGLAWLLTGVNAAVYLFAAALAGRRDPAGVRRAGAVLAGFALLLLLNAVYGRVRIAAVDAAAEERLSAGRSVKVAIPQGSAPVDNRPGELNAPGLAVYRRMTAEAVRAHAPDLVVWPESVYGRRVHFLPGDPPAFSEDFARVFSADMPAGAHMLLNSDGTEASLAGRGPVYNIAFSVDPRGRLAGLVRKRRLFPFGEYMPLGGRFPWLYRLIPGVDRLSPGGEPDPLPAAGAKAGVLICYEDLYTSAPRAFTAKGADFLVNMTNEIRFGYDGAPQHHRWYATLRAIEYRKFLLRAVNTGLTSVIDPCGRVVASVGVKERAAIAREIPLMPSSTFYSRHGRLLGHSGLLALAALALAAFFRTGRDKP